MKFGFNWPNGFREKKSEIVVIYIHSALAQGQTAPWGQIFFIYIIIQSI